MPSQTRNSALLVVLVMMLLAPTIAFAAKGVVVYKKSDCDYYIVEALLGFVVLEWYGGNDPSVGDTLVGDYETYGMKDIYNLTADSETKVWVEDFWLTKDDAMEMYYEICH